MAVPIGHLEKGGIQIIGLSSDDPNASGDAANFRISLAQTLLFPGGADNWAICLHDAQFRHPGSQSVYVSTNLSNRIDGSELTESLVRIPPTQTPGEYYYIVKSSLPLWSALYAEELREIEVQFTKGDGTNIDIHPGDVSSVTLCIKRV